MSAYCSAIYDEWLIMKLCMYVGYHDANNVSNLGVYSDGFLYCCSLKIAIQIVTAHGYGASSP